MARLQSAPAIAAEYGWLQGNWCGKTNDGQKFCEKWSLMGDRLKGQGYFFAGEAGRDTLFQEMLEIMNLEGKEVYRVRLEKDGSPVDFVIESKGSGGFLCKNMMNDFPKIIHYQIKGKDLVVDLKGNPGDSVITFKLSRQE